MLQKIRNSSLIQVRKNNMTNKETDVAKDIVQGIKHVKGAQHDITIKLQAPGLVPKIKKLMKLYVKHIILWDDPL